MAWPDGQRRLHVELPTHDLLPGQVDGVLRAAPQRACQVVLAVRAQLRSDPEQRRNGCGPEQVAPML